ncbi:3-methyl-2-oxobutanoate hydroxymethyltransferase [Candidatus Bipolaricaulota bacterium]|nr:3-methyl-2-oxobutanoate hydroxymethyltransferase [Candidatus Bipolaricaulota bacterium]
MRVTISTIQKMKARGQRIPALTAYDFLTARLVDAAGVPLVLVGDSLGMVFLGYETTIPVRLSDVLHHTKAVTRGCENALVIADMPFMTYHISEEQALENAALLIQEGGAHAVKLEGGRHMAPTVKRLVQCGIPVMGHIGLTPQSVHQLGGFKVQGKSVEQAQRLLDDAQALQDAGAFAIVLECVPAELSRIITARLQIPTIGIGAGPDCDGEIQVISDLLGLVTDFVPKHTKHYAQLADEIRSALDRYVADVAARAFPTEQQSFSIDPDVLARLVAEDVGPGEIR